jgi:hypothetical protein
LGHNSECGLQRMDANIIAAVISVSGSAVIASLGALMEWYRRKSKKRHGKQILNSLREHPVLTLEVDQAIVVNCYDDAKAGLLNAIRIRVVCQPVREELLAFLGGISTGEVLTVAHVEHSLAALREQLVRAQGQAMMLFPEPTHSVVRKLIDGHAAALSTASDLCAVHYTALRLVEMIFNIFYVSTFSVLAQWSQTANQLNGHLNGLSWNGKLLEHSFGGTITDALRILQPCVLLMHDALEQTDSCLLVLNDRGVVEGSCGSEESFGYAPAALLGLPLTALQLNIGGLDAQNDLRAFHECTTWCARVPIRAGDGAEQCCGICVSRVRFSSSNDRLFSVALLVRESDAKANNDQEVVEDAHTRGAFALSALTYTSRRVMVGCRLKPNEPPVVSASLDGAPDLPTFSTLGFLHSQMSVGQRRIEDMRARCLLRLQCDLLRSASMTYTWRHLNTTAEFYLIGHGADKSALLSIHRPVSETDRKGGMSIESTQALRINASGTPSHYAPPRTRTPRCLRWPLRVRTSRARHLSAPAPQAVPCPEAPRPASGSEQEF